MTQPITPGPHVGDIIHGHRWDGSQWIAIPDADVTDDISPVTGTTPDAHVDPTVSGGKSDGGASGATAYTWDAPPSARRVPGAPQSSGNSHRTSTGKPTPTAPTPTAPAPAVFTPPPAASGNRQRRRARRANSLGTQAANKSVKRTGKVHPAAWLLLLPVLFVGSLLLPHSDSRPSPVITGATATHLPGRVEWESAGPEPTPRDAAATQIKDTSGSFAPITASGKGPALLVLPAGITSGLIKATHGGGGLFLVKALDSANKLTEIDIDELGAFDGTAPFGTNWASSGHPPHQLQVDADGDWTIILSPMFTALPLQLPASGSTSQVFLYSGPTDGLRVTSTGDDRFIVREHRPLTTGWTVDSLVTSGGAYEGIIDAHEAPTLISVQASGPWMIAQI